MRVLRCCGCACCMWVLGRRTFGCGAIGSALLCIFRSILLVYSAGSVVNRVQVVLSGFSMRLFCFVQKNTLCRYGCMYFLAALVLVCVDVAMIRSVVKSVKVPDIEVAELTNPTGVRHRSSCDKSVRCELQANKCLTYCGEAP